MMVIIWLLYGYYMVIIWLMMVHNDLVGGAITILKNDGVQVKVSWDDMTFPYMKWIEMENKKYV
jgi:hypothetical protein